MSEIWKPIPGFEGYYEASSLGRIRSVTRPLPSGRVMAGRILRPDKPRDRYLQVTLSVNGIRHRRLVHLLVALTFIGPRDQHLQCCHNDGDRGNNAMSNLRYDTPEANRTDRRAHGTEFIGANNPAAKLSPQDIAAIRALRGQESQRALGERFGVCQSHISAIQRSVCWESVL